jgi:hypothetical protein
MQRALFSLGGSAACAACLMMVASTACSGGRTDTITRELDTADAALPEDEGGAEPVEEQSDAGPAEGEEDAAVEVPPEDAAVLDEMDASDDGGDAADAALDVTPADDAGQDAEQPGPSTPRNYLRPQDSPFADVDFAYFHLEDFEDHMLNTPGLLSVASPSSGAASGQLSSSFGGGFIDSVDGDDGIPNDNRCMRADGLCDAWWGPGTLTFTFDIEVLGALPTHVGGVWTDGVGQVSFEVFGPDGTPIYRVGPLSEPGFPDDTVSSSTGEDRFFGAYDPAGISAFTISNTQGGVEMDHVQYGRAR